MTPNIIKECPTPEDVHKQDRRHQIAEASVGFVGLIVAGAVTMWQPQVVFSYVILAVVLIWLGGCWLYSDSYDEF